MTLSLVVRAGSFGLALAALSMTAAQAAPPNLASATPGPKNGWEAFPKQLHLTFNEPVSASSEEIQLMDPDGRRIRLGTPVTTKDGMTIPTELGSGPPVEGPYMVTWQAKSTTGEIGKGNYTIFVQ